MQLSAEFVPDLMQYDIVINSVWLQQDCASHRTSNADFLRYILEERALSNRHSPLFQKTI
jgi:hypothetical protein